MDAPMDAPPMAAPPAPQWRHPGNYIGLVRSLPHELSVYLNLYLQAPQDLWRRANVNDPLPIPYTKKDRIYEQPSFSKLLRMWQSQFEESQEERQRAFEITSQRRQLKFICGEQDRQRMFDEGQKSRRETSRKSERDWSDRFASAQAVRQRDFLQKEANREQQFHKEETKRDVQFRDAHAEREEMFEANHKDLQNKSVKSEVERRSDFDNWELETISSSNERDMKARDEYVTEEWDRDRTFEDGIAAMRNWREEQRGRKSLHRPLQHR